MENLGNRTKRSEGARQRINSNNESLKELNFYGEGES
jgi:hypothetical protein